MILPGFKGSTNARSIILDVAVKLAFDELEKRYPSTALGTLASISSGGTPLKSSSISYGGSIPWAKIADVTAASKWIESTEETITEQGLTQSSAKLFPAGTVLFSMYGSIGKTAITKKPMATNQAILGLTPKNGVSSEYLYYSLINARTKLFLEAKGTSQKNINGGMVKSFRVPMPPPDMAQAVVSYLAAFEQSENIDTTQNLPLFISEQRRIVGKLEHLASKIEEARGLRQKVNTEIMALPRSVIFQDSANAAMVSMSELVSLKAPDVTVQPHETYSFAGVYSFGRGVFRGDTKRGDSFKYPKLTRVSKGNFTYPKLMAWEGALGVVPPEADGLVVSTEFPVFEVNTARVFPEVLDTYFRTPSVWPSLAEASAGTNVRRRRLHPSNFIKLLFPLPSKEVQLQHQEVLEQSQKALKLQAQTRGELDALLPSVLDKAFRGEL